MRVTQNMISQQFLYNLTNLNTNMINEETQVSTGRSLILPSDNPLGVNQDMMANNLISQSNIFSSTISNGLSWMQTTNTAMTEISQSLQSIQSDLIAALNTTNQTAESRQALSTTVQQYAQQIYTLLNTQQGNQYIFGGTTDTVPPVIASTLSEAGYTMTSLSVGISGSVEYQVAQGIEININVDAYSIMLSPLPSGTSTTATLQYTLQQIIGDIASGTESSMQGDLQNIEAAMGNMTNLTTGLGARIQRMTALQTQTSQYTTNLTNEKGVIQDANMAQVITQFNTDQIAYQAALKMGSQILLPSLVSYLP